MRIRRFRDEDAAAMTRMQRQTIRTVNRKDYTRTQIETWAGRTTAKRARQKAKERTRFVAAESGSIVGYGDFKGSRLTGLYVHRDCLGRGIGSALLEKLEETARRQGIRKFVCLSTITAKEFYKQHGYRTVRRELFPLDGQRIPVYRMVKRLS